MQKIFFCLALVVSSFSVSAMRVVIDPGHGGKDRGALKEKYNEADIVLNISKYLYKIFQHDKAITAKMTRSTDRSMTLSRRSKIIKSLNPDLLISIHANSSTFKSAKGNEFYILNDLPLEEQSMFLAYKELEGYMEKNQEADVPKSDVDLIIEDLHRVSNIKESFKLAQLLNKNWHINHSRRSSKILQAPFYILAQSDVPAVLIEVGFMSHKKELKKLLDPKYQKKIARSIYKGIKKYTHKNNFDLMANESYP